MRVSIFKHRSRGAVVSNRHLLFLLFTGLVGAVPGRRSAQDIAREEWKPAVPTGTGTENTKWTHLQQSHRPTDAPRLRGHHALPAAFADDLRKRELSIVSYDTAPVGSNTCGFLTQDGGALYCDPGYSCANIGNIRDCCAGNDCKTSSFSSVCLDYTDPACSSYTPGTRCCGGPADPQAAYCATYLWATSENPREIFTLYECEEKQWAGNFSLWAEKPIFVSDYVPASTTSRPPLAIPSSPDSSGARSSSSGDSNGSGSGSASGGLNVGAVVGGVIGGVALVGVFVLVFYYMRIRGRKAVAAAAAAAKVAAEKAHGNGSDGGGGPYGNGNGSTHMTSVGMHSPPPPSDSFWGSNGSGNGGGGGGTDPTISSTSPATVANSASAILTPEQQPLVHNQYSPQQLQEWQAFQLQQQYNLFQQQQQQQGQWVPPQDPRMDVQQMHAMQQQEETDRGMAIGMAMGMNIMAQQQRAGAKEKSPIEMSNSPTSYEVSTASLYQELDGEKGGNSAGRKELPG
ncbi:hypothetical protein V8F20_002890 [Naviculisporaceae sp. PSN 640]